MKRVAVVPGVAVLNAAGAWGFSRAFDNAGFLGGALLAAVLLAGMTTMILWAELERRVALAVGSVVWLAVVVGGLRPAARRGVEEVARFVRGKPALAKKWGSLFGPEMWRRFLADNGLEATGPNIRSYLRLRKVQGIWMKDRRRERELRGVWLDLAWLQIVLLAGAGPMGAAWPAEAPDE
ncbi:MAG: hypothetical protein ACLFQQ_12640 [Desulfococcaceae bacterium]